MKRFFLLFTLTIACALQMDAQFLIGSPAKTQLRGTSDWTDSKAVHGDMFVRTGIVILNRANNNDPSIQNALLTQDLLSIQLFDDLTVTAQKTSVRNTLSGGIYWTGNTENGELTLLILNNYLQGTLRQGNQVFDITSNETGNVNVVELNTDKNPKPNEDCFFNDDDTVEATLEVAQSELRAAANFPTPSTDAEGNYIVDILVLYPSELATASALGATSALRTAKVNTYIEEANAIFINSKINVRFRLAHDEINDVIPKNASSSSDVSGATGIGALRDLYGADIVSHWNYGGSAGSGSNWSGTSRKAVYNTSNYESVISTYTFVHECGHNMFAHHDRYEYVADGKYMTEAPGDNFGKCFPTYRTVMAYDNSKYLSGAANQSRSRIKAFTNAEVSYNPTTKTFGTGSANGFVPTGIALVPGAALTAVGDGGPADNARVINIYAKYVSAYNDPIASLPTFNVTVVGGTVNISNAVANTEIEITANPAQVGQLFSHWTTTGRGIFGNLNQATTTYTMGSEDVTLTAVFKMPSSDENPYLIASRADLEKIKDFPNEIYKLTADIDLNETYWTPIPTFSGKLYGDGHQLNNLRIASSGDYVGLFGELADGAYIKGINIIGGNISGTKASAYVGAIAGYISGDNVTITECGNTATITGVGITARVGGLVGNIKGNFATISSSFNKGNVTGGIYVGGLVGRAAEGQNTVTIRDCYSQAAVSTSITTTASSYAGGIVGYMYNGGSGKYTVENCYATGSVVNAVSTVGSAVGIVGRAWNNANTIVQHNVALQSSLQGSSSNTVAILGSNTDVGTKENFSNSEMLLNGVEKPSAETPKNGASVTLADAKTQTFYTTAPMAWDFTTTWQIRGGNFPKLKWETADIPTATSPIEATDAIVVTKYYNLQGVEVSKSATGVIIVKNIHTSGKVSTAKELRIAK